MHECLKISLAILTIERGIKKLSFFFSFRMGFLFDCKPFLKRGRHLTHTHPKTRPTAQADKIEIFFEKYGKKVLLWQLLFKSSLSTLETVYTVQPSKSSKKALSHIATTFFH